MKDNRTGDYSPLTQHPVSKPPLSVGIDVDFYQGIIDDPDVPPERKRELIEIIGSIVMSFIDLGFGVHPVQLARDEKRSRITAQTQTIETIEETHLERSDA